MEQERKRKKIGVVDALVEWILISLVLLNFLFTYLITKYSLYLGLINKPSADSDTTTISLSHNHAAPHCSNMEDESSRDIIIDDDTHELEEEANNYNEEEEEEEYNETVHLFQQQTQPPHPQKHQLHKDLETPQLLTEADGESIQVKPPLGYRDDRDGEQEAQENEEPDQTPTSLDSLHNNNNKQLLLSEKRDSSSTTTTTVEESLDDRAMTVERLKSALTSERKTLRSVYAELEEERSATAIAANHTMAMITRLQEEKAAMQMEALQYQRMMEEQAEYDQQALQLLSHLILNKDKEKDKLAKEFEVYRENHNIVLVEGEYTGDDEDDTRCSIDLNRAMIEKHSSQFIYDDSSQICDDDDDLEVMALDCMKHMSELDELLVEFEEEKLSILDQVKALEQKLLMMSGQGSEGRVEDSDIEDVQKETIQSMAKQLLPLLDEAEENESAEIEINLVQEFPDDENEAKKVDGVEEVDRVYERLKALEEENVKLEDNKR